MTVTAASLDQFDITKTQKNNNINFKCLNPLVFQKVDFHTEDTAGWKPKSGYYLYATLTNIDPDTSNPLKNVKYEDLIFLGQSTRMYEGKTMKEALSNNTYDSLTFANAIKTYFSNKEYFGNIFKDDFIHGTPNGNYHILVCNVQWTALQPENNNTTLFKDAKLKQSMFTIMTEPIYITVTYNPDKDTGKNTMVYFIPNFQNKQDLEPSPSEELQFHGYPLWMLLWGWPDWQKKLSFIQHIDESYILVIKSPFLEPKRNYYIPIDEPFINNTLEFFDPTYKEEHKQIPPLIKDQLSWHPKFWYQQLTIDKICMTGPGTCKSTQNIQAHMLYNFFFKWGGSSTTMETIADPSKQPAYPIPNNISQPIQIENPATNPETLCYPWDIRRDMCTKKFIKRLTDYEPIDETLLFSTESWTNPKAQETTKDILQTLIETQTEKEEKENKIRILNQLRSKQQQLNQQLQQLILSNIQ